VITTHVHIITRVYIGTDKSSGISPSKFLQSCLSYKHTTTQTNNTDLAYKLPQGHIDTPLDRQANIIVWKRGKYCKIQHPSIPQMILYSHSLHAQTSGHPRTSTFPLGQ